jgi:hypothetical protein
VEVDTPLHTDIVRERHWMKMFAAWDSVIIQAHASGPRIVFSFELLSEPMVCECVQCRRARRVQRGRDAAASGGEGRLADAPGDVGYSGWGQLGAGELLGRRRGRELRGRAEVRPVPRRGQRQLFRRGSRSGR